MLLNSKTGEQLSIEFDELIVIRGDTARLFVTIEKRTKNYLKTKELCIEFSG